MNVQVTKLDNRLRRVILGRLVLQECEISRLKSKILIIKSSPTNENLVNLAERSIINFDALNYSDYESSCEQDKNFALYGENYCVPSKFTIVIFKQ